MRFRRRAGWGEAGLGAGSDTVEGGAGAGRGDFATGCVRGYVGMSMWVVGGRKRPCVGCPGGMGQRRGRR